MIFCFISPSDFITRKARITTIHKIIIKFVLNLSFAFNYRFFSVIKHLRCEFGDVWAFLCQIQSKWYYQWHDSVLSEETKKNMLASDWITCLRSIILRRSWRLMPVFISHKELKAWINTVWNTVIEGWIYFENRTEILPTLINGFLFSDFAEV